MKMSIALDRPETTAYIHNRTNVFVWKNLDHLKDFYAGIVDPREIDLIAERFTAGTSQPGSYTFRMRKDAGDALNESCLCNLVEMNLLDTQEVLNAFLEKPVL